jgi:hypothetical protein
VLTEWCQVEACGEFSFRVFHYCVSTVHSLLKLSQRRRRTIDVDDMVVQ